MNARKEWEKDVKIVFNKMKSHKKIYSIHINKTKLYIFPDVFSPAYFTDSNWFAKTVAKIVGKHSLLEIGTGTGIVALFAALNGANVTVSDINPAAVKNAEYNFKYHQIKAKAYCGDMYKPIPSKEKFDFIFWNHPFSKGTNPNEDILLKSGFDFQYQGLEQYISEAHFHLNPKGRLLLGTGNFARLSEVKKLSAKYNYKLKLLKKISMPLTAGNTIENNYRVYELVKKSINKK
jgi:methylase of polypeptide subunit release factors